MYATYSIKRSTTAYYIVTLKWIKLLSKNTMKQVTFKFVVKNSSSVRLESEICRYI